MDSAWLFVISCLAFSLVPGPAMLYTVSRTAKKGVRSGVFIVVGIFCGSQAHVVVAASGAAGLLLTQPLLFDALRYAGALYFLYMGARHLYWLYHSGHHSDTTAQQRPVSFKESVMVEVLNPKSSLFYLAFIPQFLPADSAHPVLMLFVIGTLANAIMSVVDLTLVVITHRLKQYAGVLANRQGVGEWAQATVFFSLAAAVIWN